MEPPARIVALAEERAAARTRKDFDSADALRREIEDAGLTVVAWRVESGAETGGQDMLLLDARPAPAPGGADAVSSAG